MSNTGGGGRVYPPPPFSYLGSVGGIEPTTTHDAIALYRARPADRLQDVRHGGVEGPLVLQLVG